jgi:hypothetical protein
MHRKFFWAALLFCGALIWWFFDNLMYDWVWNRLQAHGFQESKLLDTITGHFVSFLVAIAAMTAAYFIGRRTALPEIHPAPLAPAKEKRLQDKQDLGRLELEAQLAAVNAADTKPPSDVVRARPEPADFAEWDKVDPLTIWQAAMLWLGWNPSNPRPPEKLDIESENRLAPHLSGLIQGVRAGWVGIAVPGEAPSSANTETHLSRGTLLKYAERVKERPKFLYPEARAGAVVQTEPEPDISLYDALWAGYLKTWNKPTHDPDRNAVTEPWPGYWDGFYAFVAEVRQIAFDGKLPIWGRQGTTLSIALMSPSLRKPIPKEFWEHNTIDLLELLHNDPAKLATSPILRRGNASEGWSDLWTNKAAVERLWPMTGRPDRPVEPLAKISITEVSEATGGEAGPQTVYRGHIRAERPLTRVTVIARAAQNSMGQLSYSEWLWKPSVRLAERGGLVKGEDLSVVVLTRALGTGDDSIESLGIRRIVPQESAGNLAPRMFHQIEIQLSCDEGTQTEKFYFSFRNAGGIRLRDRLPPSEVSHITDRQQVIG